MIASTSLSCRPCQVSFVQHTHDNALKIRKARLNSTELDSRLTSSYYKNVMLNNITELDLSYNLLTYIPLCLYQLCNLRHLNLSSNKLSEFPHHITQFIKLETLNLSRNKLQEEFPPNYCEKLSRLKTLRLCDNLIPSLPSNFHLLTSLEYLFLGSSTGGNLIHSFPSNTITLLKKLKTLDLSHNRFSSLPFDIGFQGSKLEYLCVHNNNLVSLPRTIGLCQNLKSLDLSKNCISFLPLELVDLEGLQSLDLSSNSLCVIPSDIAAYMRRTSLLLTGNPMISQREQLSSIGDFSGEPLSNTQSGSSSPNFSGPLFSTQQLTQRLTALQLSSQESREEMVPSLRELAARAVLAQGIPVNPALLPRNVMRALDPGARPCGLCRQPYVSEYLERVELRGCQGHPNLPTSVAYCSTRCHTLSSSTTPISATPKTSFMSPCPSKYQHFSPPDKISRSFGLHQYDSCSPLTPRSWKPKCVLSKPQFTNSISINSTPVVPVSDLTMVDSLNDW